MTSPEKDSAENITMLFLTDTHIFISVFIGLAVLALIAALMSYTMIKLKQKNG